MAVWGYSAAAVVVVEEGLAVAVGGRAVVVGEEAGGSRAWAGVGLCWHGRRGWC